MRVNSEVGKLKKVIIHRPDSAIKRLTPNNCNSFLFDDIPQLEKAIEEHLYFENVLREHGVETLLLHETVGRELLPPLGQAFAGLGVELRGCEKTCEVLSSVGPASEQDWYEEFWFYIFSKVIFPCN